MSLFWAALLKPLFFAGLMAVVALIGWLIFKVIPDGKLKVFLFKVRYDQKTNTFQSPSDKIVYWVAIVVLIGGLFAFIGWLA